MFGSIKAIIYRNFWLTYKMNLLSLIFIGWGLLNSIASHVPMSYLYSFLVILMHIQQQSLYTHSMVDDRASNFKVTYHIMGLKKNYYIIGQAVSFLIQGFVINCLMFAVGIGYNAYAKNPLITDYDKSLFLMAFVYLLIITFYSISLSFLFKNPAVSKDLSVAFNVILFYATAYLVTQNKLQIVQLISPYAFIIKFGYDFVIGGGQNVPSMFPSIYLMLGQAAFYFVLAIYFENVIGGDDDHNKHPLFFLNFLKSAKESEGVRRMSNSILTENYERDIECDKDGLTVIDLSKKFGNFSALKSVSVNFSSGKMHCMLGHNGAGKSTFINILTGMYKASGGHMIYKGENLINLHKNESSKINIGICPPSDILFPNLTVYQHLKMMCFIKDQSDFEGKITLIMRQLNIVEYSNYKVDQLSGGNKRKLTIAMSIIGNPNLLFLDEPTSALDPVSRKDIWRILLDIKSQNKNMITILTTHHLEEAETLADNIVVLAAGTIKIKGTINEIKREFGIGYDMEVISDDPVPASTFEQFVKNVNSTLQTTAINPADYVISDRKIEIKIGLSQTKSISKLSGAIKANVPAGMIFTVNSNTLEKAYIEIDKDLHKDSKINNFENLVEVLKRLYTNKKSTAVEKIKIIFINKFLFLSTNPIEIFKILAHYTILGSTLGFILYFVNEKKIEMSVDVLSGFFMFMIFLEIVLSSFSVLNLVYDQSKDLKFMLFVNKITPQIYYAGKFLADLVLVTLGYGVIFVVFYALLNEELKKIEDLTAMFFLFCFKLYMWRMAYSCVGMLYFRIFPNTKAVLSYYALLYIGIYIVASILSKKLWDKLFYLNDLSLIISLFNKPGVGYLEVFSSFFILGLGHIVVALFLENRALRFNFRNDRVEKKNYVENNEENVFIDTVNEIQSKLRRSISKEINETLSFEPKKLKVVDLKKQYNPSKVALDEVTFSIAETTQFGLVGPNGAGKSTLFNILLGKVFKTSGSLTMDNAKEYQGFFNYLFEKSPYDFNQYGVCFQGDSTWEQLKVIDNLRFFMQLHKINESALMELLEYFEFRHYLEKRAIDLSSGNKRKLCIIISLMINPNMLLFDEATCGVDLYMRLRLKFIFQYFFIYNKSTAIFTTHFLKDIEVFCDKIGLISQGQFLCIDYIHNIKQILGGYFSHLHFNDLAHKDRVIDTLSRFAAVKITHNDDETKSIKCLFNRVTSILDIFEYLLASEEEGILKEFSINQLSIEDIYLDVFNRSE
jgi:ATP-binding cassette subfamily A (ABC1) protein 3